MKNFIQGYPKDPQVLLLGDKRLYTIAKPVLKTEIKKIPAIIKQMHGILSQYKKKYGKFRAIAAPQIGLAKQLIYLYIQKPIIFINPILKNKSKEMMEVWDDCMSFPDLLVKVKRHRRCTIDYFDLSWQKHSLDLEGDMSELLQHEYDHLEGILATDRAINLRSFAVFLRK